MIRLLLAMVVMLTLTTAATAQNWEFSVEDWGGNSGMFYKLDKKTPGVVFGCEGNTAKSAIQFGCLSSERKIKAVIYINECEMDGLKRGAEGDLNFLVSTDQYLNMPARGATINAGGKNSYITVALSGTYAQRFRAMILESDGYTPIQVERPGISLETGHYFDNRADFQSKFYKFPSLCKM